MKSVLRIPLTPSPEQANRLQALQKGFAEVCNALAPMVQQTRVWNRVALHHLAYRQLRARYPAMGSQMVCNAIYSVSRTCRMVFQNPASPFHLSRLAGRPLPLLRFSDRSPVYFDRHTLSLKAGQLSMFTLDGRMRFRLALQPQDEALFHELKLREIVLSRSVQGVYMLSFVLVDPDAPQEDAVPAGRSDAEIPEYVMVEETA